MGKLVITVGETVETANRRLFENVRRAKAGELVEVDTRINFADAKTMCWPLWRTTIQRASTRLRPALAGATAAYMRTCKPCSTSG